MIRFDSIQIEGFGSIIKGLSYSFNNPGINLINGKNGAGKTTIFSALSWALFGITLKKDCTVEPWEQFKLDAFLGTKVVVNMRVGSESVCIIRCKDWKGKEEGSKGNNRILLYINDIYQEQLRDKKDVQKKINQILGMSFNLFKNSLVFGQKLTRLLSEEGAKQKELFDEAFDASFINVAREKAKADKEITEVEFAKLQRDNDTYRNEYKTWKNSIEGTKKLWQSQQQEQIKSLQVDLSKLNENIKAVRETKEAYFKLRDHEKDIQGKLAELETKVQTIWKLEQKQFQFEMTLSNEQAEIKGIKQKRIELKKKLSSKQMICPMCEQPLNKEDHQKVRTKLKADFTYEGVKLKESLKVVKKMEAMLEKIKSSLLSCMNDKNEYNRLKKELDFMYAYGYDEVEYRPKLLPKLKIQKEELEKRIEAKSQEKPDMSDWYKKRNKAKEGIQKLKPDLIEFKRKLKLYDWLISDPLSNKGLKAYIFNSMLDTVNKRLEAYSRYLGFRIVLGMDLDSHNKNFQATIYKNKTKVSYEDLSGGQQQLADVCLAFAVHETTSQDRFNILLMDEVFESLDEDNVEKIWELLYAKADKISIHLITHLKRAESVKLANTTNIKLTATGSVIV